MDLDIGWLSESLEDDPGGIVVRRADGNNAPRKLIVLKSSLLTGNVTLTRNNTKVKVFTAETGGTEITFNGTDNKFPVADLTKELFVQGHEASAVMRDVTLTLTHDAGASDSVKFTVLWVTLSTKHTGNIADDNSAKALYNSTMVPPSSALGHQLQVYDERFGGEDAALVRGSEFIGSVKPSNFQPADFSFGGSMKLVRELVATIGNVAGTRYWGPPPNGNANLENVIAGDDTSGVEWRDDDPQSGGSNGKIYDLDTPGIIALFTEVQNTIQRLRTNFRFWATYGGTRCSPKKEWYTRQSYKLAGSVDSGTAESGTANTLTDANKNWAANKWVPGAITITAGKGIGQFRRITASTATKITVASDWDPQPDATSQYRVINTTTWVQHNDIAGDNKNADGSTNILWDLQ